MNGTPVCPPPACYTVLTVKANILTRGMLKLPAAYFTYFKLELVFVFSVFSYRKMRKKVGSFALRQRMLSGFLADHRMGC